MYNYSSAYCFDACKVTALFLTLHLFETDLSPFPKIASVSQMVALSEEREILEKWEVYAS